LDRAALGDAGQRGGEGECLSAAERLDVVDGRSSRSRAEERRGEESRDIVFLFNRRGSRQLVG